LGLSACAALLGAVSLIAGARPAPAGINLWSSKGPGETVYALAIDPTTPTTLYAGADAGVFKSTDGGSTWNTSLSGHASGLVIAPNTSTTLYAVTSNGLFKTSNAGSTSVTIDELITLVNIALGTAQSSACPHGVPSGAGVDVALIIQAVNVALNGCGA
jgi:hypothetical protein